MSSNSSSNLLYGCDGEVKNTIPKTEYYAVGIIMILTIVISIFGNSLVILAVYRFKSLQTSTNALLCSLAITDLFGPVLRLSFLATTMFLQQWIFGCKWCIASSTLGIFFGACSINHLCLISIERCITICYPYKALGWITTKTVSIGIAMVWILSLSMALFPFFGVGLLRFNNHILDCEVFLQNNPKLGILLGGVYFLLPCLMMVMVYGTIFGTVRAQTQKMSAYTVGSREDKHKLRIKSELKAVKTVLVVIGFFFLLWLPYFCTSAIEPYRPHFIKAWWKRFSFTLAYMNGCCNWIVYSVRNRKMRDAFKEILGLKKSYDTEFRMTNK